MSNTHWCSNICKVLILGLAVTLVTVSDSIPTSDAQTIISIIESDSPIVQQVGAWNLQLSPNASGGNYLYSSGSKNDVLTLDFYGSSVEIVYIENPNAGTFAIEIDNNIHRTVATSNENTTYNNHASIQYLEDEQHTLRVFPVEGVIAIDAFLAIPTRAEVALPASQGEIFDDLPTNIIVIIGDGMGFEHIEAGGYFVNGATGQFPFESFPYIAEMTVGMAGQPWTDSAASATAMATGIKVGDGVLSMAIPGDGTDLETIMEYLQPLGISTGLITTAQVASATPAAFVSHNPSRNNYQEITADILQTKPNLFFAGNNDWMTPQTASEVGYTVLQSRDSMLAFDTESATYVSGQFSSWSMPYEFDGYPSTVPHLFEMTTTALNILDNNPNGFLIIIENEHTDSAGHINDIQRNVYETKAVADAVQSAIDWANGRSDTLIIVTADHETGGLNVLENNGQGNLPTVTWTSTAHSSRHVPIYAWGAGAERINGVIDNTDLYRLFRGWAPVANSGVTITPTDLNIPASATTSSYNIVLRTQPTANVKVSFETTGNVSVDQNSITFSTSNWNIPQTITVNATGDGQILHTTESSDRTYHEIYLVDDVNVTLDDFPTAPTDLQATTSATNIDLTWTDNSSDETAFHIERSLNGTDWTELTTVAADTTSYQDTVDCGTTYYYRVRAFRSSDSAFSTYSNTDQTTSDPCPLPAPSNLTATPNDSTQIDLAWTDNSTDETNFRIERSPDGSTGWTEIETAAADATTYSDTGLTASTALHYRVRAYRAAGGGFAEAFSNYTNVDTEKTAPSAPSSLTVTTVSGELNLELSWTDNASDETNFRIERSPDGSTGWTEIDTAAADATTYSDTGLTASTAYHYRVRAYRAAGGGHAESFSNYTNVDTDKTAPSAPSSLTLTSVSGELSLELSWTDNASDETNVRIERSPNGSTNWVEIDTAVADATTYSDTGLDPSTEYFYRVRAYRAPDSTYPEAFSNYSNVDSSTTVSAAPSNLSAQALPYSGNDIQLDWTDNSSDETDFEIERSLANTSNWAIVTTVSSNTTTYTDASLVCEVTYDYRIRAYRSSDNTYSMVSNTVQVTVYCAPEEPYNLTVTNTSETSITIGWTDDATNETAYLVERSPDNSNWTQIASLGADVETYEDTTVDCETQYYYRVRAYRDDIDVYSYYSNTDQATTSVCPSLNPTLIAPLNITFSDLSNLPPTFEWNEAINTTWYRFYLLKGAAIISDIWFEKGNSDMSCNGLTCTLTPDLTLSNGNYTWYIRGWSSPSGYTEWSDSAAFTLNVPTPTTINKIAPSAGTTLTDPLTTFSWDHDPNALWYEFNVAAVSTLYKAADICDAGTCSTQRSLSNANYTWYVRGWGPGSYGPWGSGFAFTIAVPKPVLVNKISPSSGTTLTAPNPTFTWEFDPNVTWYQFNVEGVSTWYEAATICVASTCSIQKNIANAAHKWYVRGWGPGGYGDWGNGISFTLAVPKPALIVKTAPIGPTSSANPNFVWQHDPDAAWYQIWIGKGSIATYYEWHSAADICTAGTCTLNTAKTFIGDYSWVVRGWSIGGYGDWGSVTNFSYALALNAPTGSVSGANITYQWDHVDSNTTWYRIWVGTTGGTQLIYEWIDASLICNTTSCAFTKSITLPAGNYIWYLQPYGTTYGSGAWSAAQPFTVSP